MANPQKENGYSPIANEILEALGRFKSLSHSEWCVIMMVLRYTYGFNRKQADLSLTFIARGTGLSRQSVARSIKKLVAKRLLGREKSATKFNKNYEEWVVAKRLLGGKAVTRVVAKSPPEVVAKSPPKKDNVKTTKEIHTEASPPPVVPKVRTPMQIVIDHFLDQQGLDPAQRKLVYKRHLRDANDLLEVCNKDPVKACGVLDSLKAWCDSKKLSYNIGTALKHWHRFAQAAPSESYDNRLKRIADEIEAYKKEHNLS